jgi:hypothetical protein
MANYREGPYVSPWPWEGNRTHNIDRVRLGADQRLRGELDWDSLENVQGHLKDLKTIRLIADSQRRYFSADNARDTSLDQVLASGHSGIGPAQNPFHSQGLGPKDYAGKFNSDRASVQSQFWEATERKFQLRERELQGIASAPAAGGFSAGTQEAYDAQRAARRLLGKPFPEAARAAELLRSERGPRAGGGGGGQPGSSRQTSRAGSAERRRLASNDRTTGGSGGSARKRLRAANLLGQPLGGGSQSAAQVLG